MAASTIYSVLSSPYAKDKTGERYGSLVVVRPLFRKDGHIYWLCRCDCGNEKEVGSNRLREGAIKSCGRYCSVSKYRPHWSGHKEISGTYWNSVRYGARTRNLELSITKKEAWEIYEQQGRKCVYSALPISFGAARTASLDRIDSQRGYESGNIQWLHCSVNRMKWNLSERDFLRICYLTSSPRRRVAPILLSKKNPKWKGVGNIPCWLLGRLKNIACRRKLSFDDAVDVSYLWDLYVKQEGVCSYLGIPINFPIHSYARKTATASLDRIDSSIGYTRGNLQWIHKDVNQIKGTLSDIEFRDFCQKIVTNSSLLAELSEGRAA